MARAGRLAWRGLALRVALPKTLVVDEPPALCAQEPATQRDAFPDPNQDAPPNPEHAWCMACPDVFSIRRTTVQAYLEPVVHEIKVSRADLLGDLKRPAKRAAYLEMASACWYVLGMNAKGQPIAKADEVPAECGVLMAGPNGLRVAREAPRRGVPELPFEVWMCLAKAGAVRVDEAMGQGLLGDGLPGL